MYVCMYVCVCVCTCINIYTYIHTYIHIHMHTYIHSVCCNAGTKACIHSVVVAMRVQRHTCIALLLQCGTYIHSVCCNAGKKGFAGQDTVLNRRNLHHAFEHLAAERDTEHHSCKDPPLPLSKHTKIQRACLAAWHHARESGHQQSAYVSIRQHTTAYVRIRQHTSAYLAPCSRGWAPKESQKCT